MPDRDDSRDPGTAHDRLLPGPGLLLAHGLLYVVVLFVAAAVVWSWATRVDVVAEAQGRLLPRGGPLRLSTPQDGIVSQVLVEIGAEVKAGEPLLHIDAFREDADATRLRYELEAARLEADRLEQENGSLRAGVAFSREQLARERRAHELRERVASRTRKLAAEGVASALDVDVRDREVAELESRLAELGAQIERGEQGILESQRLAAAARAIVGAREAALGQATEARRRTVVTAPRAGTITRLVATSPGRYVEATEVAAELLPRDEPLFAELRIPNASMRGVKTGLPVRLKLDAYPYQDYGVVEGALERIEPDPDDSGAYRAWARLAGSGIAEPGRLRPGLLLTAEIVIDRKRVIAIVLDPFRKLSDGLRLVE